MSKKPFNIGLIGPGFMGRTHSNAYRRVSNFFDLDGGTGLTAEQSLFLLRLSPSTAGTVARTVSIAIVRVATPHLDDW